jgi:ubiquinone/menaquinone biosynthesis C-methylase UbiE
MKLNLFEKALMLNPLRPVFQRHFEARNLLGPLRGVRLRTILEVGCGSGDGVPILFDMLAAEKVHAFDLDKTMVWEARKRLTQYTGCLHLWVGNARQIPCRDHRYDGVVTFGALHHIRDWRKAVREIHRVLKPGGIFFAEEISKRFIVNPVFRRLIKHPQKDRFDRPTLVQTLRRTGFDITSSKQFLDLFIWVVSRKP